MDRLTSMEMFIAVAEAHSFSVAARRLGVSAPSVTRGVNALEERLGVKLLTRTTRSVRLTEVGAAYLPDCRRVTEDAKTIDEAASGAFANPAGNLRLTAPTQFGRLYVMPILTAFLDAYPGVSADALFVDRVVNLMDEGLDVAVRIGSLPPSELAAIRVGAVRQVVCAAPAYLDARGRPDHPHALTGHQVVLAAPVTPAREWRFGQDVAVRVAPRLTVSTVPAALDAARAGWGVTRLLSYQVAPDVEAGRLALVLEDFEPPALPVHLVHPEGRRPAAKLRTFLDFAATRLRASAARW
ncbi:MAG: LysR family transcriptional regulator [Pseudomonadota bacterium]